MLKKTIRKKRTTKKVFLDNLAIDLLNLKISEVRVRKVVKRTGTCHKGISDNFEEAFSIIKKKVNFYDKIHKEIKK